MIASDFMPLTDEEAKAAHATIDKVGATWPETYRNTLKYTVVKSGGVVLLPVNRPQREDRTRPPGAGIGLDPWLEHQTMYVPLAEALAELASAAGAELTRRYLASWNEERAGQLRRIEAEKQHAADMVRANVEEQARQKAWAALSDAERAVIHLTREHGRKQGAQGIIPPPSGWKQP